MWRDVVAVSFSIARRYAAGGKADWKGEGVPDAGRSLGRGVFQ